MGFGLFCVLGEWSGLKVVVSKDVFFIWYIDIFLFIGLFVIFIFNVNI